MYLTSHWNAFDGTTISILVLSVCYRERETANSFWYYFASGNARQELPSPQFLYFSVLDSFILTLVEFYSAQLHWANGSQLNRFKYSVIPLTATLYSGPSFVSKCTFLQFQQKAKWRDSDMFKRLFSYRKALSFLVAPCSIFNLYSFSTFSYFSPLEHYRAFL